MAMVIAGTRPAAGEAAPAREPVRSHTLWRPEDFMRWVLTVGLGGIVLVASWYVCAGDASFYRQIGPLNGAVAGVIIAGLGNVMWLLRGRRMIGERRRALLPDPVVVAAGDEVATGTAPSASDLELYVAGEGLARFHRPGCTLAVGRSWTGAPRQAHLELGRRPCGVCRP
jgi:hypothetical protein